MGRSCHLLFMFVKDHDLFKNFVIIVLVFFFFSGANPFFCFRTQERELDCMSFSFLAFIGVFLVYSLFKKILENEKHS